MGKKLFTFSRSSKNQERVPKNGPKVRPVNPRAAKELPGKKRFKKPTEILKKMNITLMGKMEELRVLPSNVVNDSIGSFFYDELQHTSLTETNFFFRDFYMSIVDKSQTLPLILLNRSFIVKKLLEKYSNRYFQSISARLLIALIRDCGEEIYEDFVGSITQTISEHISVSNLPGLEQGFKVFASAFRFLLKPLQKKADDFVSKFLACMLPKRNAYIRRFTAESVQYILSKIRVKDQLNQVAAKVFGLELTELGLSDEGLEGKKSKNFKQDFEANLLFLLLKGENGSVSFTGKQLVPFLQTFMQDGTEEKAVLLKKAFNLFVDHEFKFFRRKGTPGAANELPDHLPLEEFLSLLCKKASKIDYSIPFIANMLSILSELSIANRFTKEMLVPLGSLLKSLDLESLVRPTASEKYSQPLRTLLSLFAGLCVNKCNLPHSDPHELVIIGELLTNKKIIGALKKEEVRFFFKLLFNGGGNRIRVGTNLALEEESDPRKEDKMAIPTIHRCYPHLLLLTMFTLSTGPTLLLQSVLLRHSSAQRHMRLTFEPQGYSLIEEIVLNGGAMARDIAGNKMLKAEEIDRVITWIGAVKLVRESANWVSGRQKGTGIKQVYMQVKKAEKKVSGKKEGNGGALTVNYSLESFENVLVVLKTELLSLLMSGLTQTQTFNSQAEELACFLVKEITELLENTQENHTQICLLTLELSKCLIGLSKLAGKPISSIVVDRNQKGKANDGNEDLLLEKTEDFALKFSFKLNKRLMRFLWSKVPEARISMLRLLLPAKSEILKALIGLDSVEASLYEERGLFIEMEKLATDLFYKKYTDYEEEIIANFLIGFTGFRVQTLQVPLSECLASIIYHQPTLFEDFFDFMELLTAQIPGALTGLQGKRAAQIDKDKGDKPGLEKSDLKYVQKFVSAQVDAVDLDVQTTRIYDLLEQIVSYNGNRINKYSKKKTGTETSATSQAIMAEEAINGQEKGSFKNPNKQKEPEDTTAGDSAQWLERLYKIFTRLVRNELQYGAIPSLSRLFKDEKSEEMSAKTNKADFKYYQDLKGEIPAQQILEESMALHAQEKKDSNIPTRVKISGIERMKRLLRAFKSSPKLSKCSFRQEFHGFLLEILRFPNQDTQILAMQTLFRLNRDNKLIRQHSALLLGLTAKDGFKDHILKTIDKIRAFSSLERQQLLPIIEASIFKRFTDRSSTKNRRQFEANREAVVELVASVYDEREVGTLLSGVLSGYGLGELAKGLLTSENSEKLQYHSLMERPTAVLTNRFAAMCDVLKPFVEKLHRLFNQRHLAILLYLLGGAITICNSVVESSREAGGDEVADEEPESQEEESKENESEAGMDEEEIEPETAAEKNELKKVIAMVKTVRLSAFKRLVQLMSLNIEYEQTVGYHDFLRMLMPSLKTNLERFETKPISTVPMALRLMGLWGECELYKHYFLAFPYTIDSLIKIFANPHCSAKVYTETFDLISNIANFGIGEDQKDVLNVETACQKYLQTSETHFTVISPVDATEITLSALGNHCLSNCIDRLISNLAVLSSNLEGKKKSLPYLRPSDFNNLNKRFSDFALYLSQFMKEGEATAKFYEVSKKGWAVDQINKKTAKPYGQIQSATELVIVQKETAAATNMLRILGGFAAKIDKIEELFFDFLLPLIARLEDVKLRASLADVLEQLVQNPVFSRLGISQDFIEGQVKMFKLVKSLAKPSVDYNYVVDVLIDKSSGYERLQKNEKYLLMAQCLFLLTSPEMSSREKSLELTSKYIKEADFEDESDQNFYKKCLLANIAYYFNGHFGREHVMKYYSNLLRFHCLKLQGLQTAGEELPTHPYNLYFDLLPLVSSETSKDFLLQIFDLKISTKAAAVSQLRKYCQRHYEREEAKTHQTSPLFTRHTCGTILQKVLDFYLYQYAGSQLGSGGASSAYSQARTDSIRNIIASVFETYGLVVSCVDMGFLVKTCKDKMFVVGGKKGRGLSEAFTETSVKIVCSIVGRVPKGLRSSIEEIQKEQQALLEAGKKEGLLGQVVEVFEQAEEEAKEEKEEGIVRQIDSDEEEEDSEISEVEDELGHQIKKMDIEGENKIELTATQVKTLKDYILKPLKRYLLKPIPGEDSKHSVRPEVAMAILQIIKLFAHGPFNSELVSLISKICSVLVDRDEDRRKTARGSLIGMIKILGPFFFGFFVQELSFHLKRGFETHVRNFVIFKLIETLVTKPTSVSKKARKAASDSYDPYAAICKPGQLDYSLPAVCPLLLSEICGDLEEQKEVTEIKNKSVEFRRNKGLDSFKMIAEVLDLSSGSLAELMKPMTEIFLTHQSLQKIVGKFNELAAAVIGGLMINKTLNVFSTVVFIRDTSAEALANIKKPTVEESVDVRPENLNLDPCSTALSREEKMKENFVVQEGASQGASICKFLSYDSQDQS